MPVFAPRGFDRRYPSLGLVIEKPRLGRGNGGAHSYATHYRSEGFGGYCYLSHEALDWVFTAMERDGVPMTGSHVLHISGAKDNPKDQRRYYVFFRRPGDAIMFKTYLMETPEITRTDTKRAYYEPHLHIW